MTAGERWRRARELLAEALALPAAERSAFLDEGCAGDASLCAEIESLLAVAGDVGDFLERPALADSSLADASLARPEETAPPRARIGPYRVLRELGHGGMGTVYLAVRDGDFAKP